MIHWQQLALLGVILMVPTIACGIYASDNHNAKAARIGWLLFGCALLLEIGAILIAPWGA